MEQTSCGPGFLPCNNNDVAVHTSFMFRVTENRPYGRHVLQRKRTQGGRDERSRGQYLLYSKELRLSLRDVIFIRWNEDIKMIANPNK